MEKEKLIIRLSTQVDTIKAHVNRLKKPGYNLHALDVDMLRQKTYEFYEHVTELENLLAGEPVRQNKPEPVIKKEVIEIVEEVIVPEKKVEETVEEVIVPEKIVEETVELSPEIEEPAKQIIDDLPEELISSPVIAVESEQMDEDNNEQVTEEEVVEKVPELIVELEPSKQTAYDLFSENSENVVAEKFYANEEQSIADKMQKSHISNIREAIGINEKFLFINELFNGDLGRYNKIIDDINELPTKKGVETYLLELKVQFQWADENEAYIKLKELLDRKFG